MVILNKQYVHVLKRYLPLVVYPLICMTFYGYVGINTNVAKMLMFITQPIMLVVCLRTLTLRIQDPVFNYMRCILVLMFVSMIVCWVSWGQGLVLSYRAMGSQFTILFFFFLIRNKTTTREIENTTLFFGILYCLLWLYAMSRIPQLTFGFSEDGEVSDNMSRGIIRINFAGRQMLILAYFICINRFFTAIKRKSLWLALAVTLFVFLVLQVTRQLILFSALVTAIYVFYRSKKTAAVIIFALILAFGVVGNIQFSDDSVIGSLINMTENQAESNNRHEDIRITEYKYFFTEYSQNILTDIFGSGYPHGDSSFGHYYDKVRFSMDLYLSDVGYARMFAQGGYVGLLLWLLLFSTCAGRKMPAHLDYARMYMLFSIPANIAASWFCTSDGLFCIAVSSYLIMLYGKSNFVIKSIK